MAGKPEIEKQKALMEARDGEQAKAPKKPPKQRRQGKSGNGARTQNTASHDEELAAQLAKIERELRRKERKFEKYNKVLKAKEHVRNTLRQHSAASEGRDRASTDTPAQNTPPRPTKPCSSRSVTFSTKSPEVQYITTRCHTPTDRDQGTTPPPPHAKEEAVRSSEVPAGSCEGAVGVSVDVPVKEGSGLKGRVKERESKFL
ncbi:uncharacterized protein LOC123514673 [Portunus trituberculatus]|uniref:uncharacterized protein LOC123514673 n=1 Tax=Portunus trituberculatus TaxID=210409 RepID=UPI001E1CBFA5|nr:uncharacterized protein LOC123514673 [Portunus trituberculatus]